MDDDPLWQEIGPASAEAETKSESELTSDVDALRSAIRARDRAVTVVAHDLRNPISVIIQTSSMLLRTLANPVTHVLRVREVTTARRVTRTK